MSAEERYVELGLRLGRHIDGLVDSYYGDPAVKERIDAEPLREPSELLDDAHELVLEADSPWLLAQLIGLETVAGKLAGKKIPYADEVELLYGVRPRRTPDSEFEAAHAALDGVLPGDGSLSERYRAWREGDPIPADRLEAILEEITEDLRSRTSDLLGLPDGEGYRIEIVSDEPWAAYNYYEGGLQSRIAVNTDVPLAPNFITELLAHELYPGHHAEHAWKERLLYLDGGRIEHGILMIGTPESLIAEGIAGVAVEILLEDEDVFTAEHLARHGIEYDAALAREARRAKRAFERVGGNAALLLYEDGASEDEALEYLKRWALMSDLRAAKALSFITDPIWRSYVTTYADGYEVCSKWVAGDPARFKRLLTEPLTPADLAR